MGVIAGALSFSFTTITKQPTQQPHVLVLIFPKLLFFFAAFLSYPRGVLKEKDDLKFYKYKALLEQRFTTEIHEYRI